MCAANIKDLAKALGLSAATVSRAMRDSHEISPETKQKVRKLAKELNYVPNPFASGLRKRKSKTIAVVLPEVADSFFSLAINGIEAVAQERGYHVLIYLTHENFEREKAILNEFKSGRVDGILISVSEETNSGHHIKEVINTGTPVVFFDRVCDDVNTAKVITDDLESSYNATQLLIDQGCKRVAYLSISPDLSINQKRMNGYKKALEVNGIKFNDKDIIFCGNDLNENYLLIKNILNKKNRPDGIVSSVEKLVTPVYLACKDLKLSIPDKIKIVCFTNLQTSLILNPALTTITQPAFEMGETAAALLCKGIEKKNFDLTKEKIIICSELVKRQSA